MAQKKKLIRHPTKMHKQTHKQMHKVADHKSEMDELLTIPSTEYDKIFEEKLAEQYKMFRELKEHHMQTKKFIRIFIAILVIILVALLLMTYT